MTEHLNTPVVRIPVMAAIGTGANSGYLDINFTPEDLEPPDEEFWAYHAEGIYEVYWDSRNCKLYLLDEDVGVTVPTPKTKAHAKMLIYLLTGDESVLTNVKSCPVDNSAHPSTIRPDGQEATNS